MAKGDVADAFESIWIMPDGSGVIVEMDGDFYTVNPISEGPPYVLGAPHGSREHWTQVFP